MTPMKSPQGKEVHQFLLTIRTRVLKRFVDAYMSSIDGPRTTTTTIKRPGRPSVTATKQSFIPLSRGVFLVIADELDTLDHFLLTHPHCQMQGLALAVVRCILENLEKAQRELRDFLLGDVQCCCRASREFMKLMEMTEETILVARSRYHLQSPQHQQKEEDDNKSVGHQFALDANAESILSLFCSDAVVAAQKTHSFILDNASKSMERGLFQRQWEEGNSSVVSLLIQAMEAQIPDLELLLGNNFLLKKAIDALASATVVLYIQCFVAKAQQRRWKSSIKSASVFADPARAVVQMRADVIALRSYFTKLIPKMPALLRTVEREFSFLWAMWEIMAFASGTTTTIKVMDSFDTIRFRIQNMDLASRLVCDLWYAASPTKLPVTWKSVVPPSSAYDDNENNQGASNQAAAAASSSSIDVLRLENTLAHSYSDDIRKSLPIVLPRQLVLGLSSRYHSESKLKPSSLARSTSLQSSPRRCPLPVHDAVMT